MSATKNLSFCDTTRRVARSVQSTNYAVFTTILHDGVATSTAVPPLHLNIFLPAFKFLSASIASVDFADAKVQAPPEVDDRHYPQLTKALMVLVGSLSLVLFWTTVYWSARFGLWLLSLFGSLRPHVTAVLVVYLAVSFVRSFQPSQPLPHIPAVGQQSVRGGQSVDPSRVGARPTASSGNDGNGHAAFTS